MKKATRISAFVILLILSATCLYACGRKNNDKDKKTLGVSNGGQVLNIYCWNEEFITRVADHYPGYEEVSATEGRIGDLRVIWTVTSNEGNQYQNALDADLTRQGDAASNERIDMFLVEADYALKYVDSKYTVDLKEIGIDPERDLVNQYKYTRDVVTDSKGAVKGSSWQASPGLMVYRRDIAQEVLGTDDPNEVQKAVSDWAKFEDTAAKMKQSGYAMVSGYDDTYRIFSNNVSSPWVVDGKLNIDDSIMQWVDQTKRFTDAGYNEKTTLWGDAWSKGFYENGKVFCYFGPAWFIDFSMHADKEGSVGEKGGWAVTNGPQSFFWGGTWLCCADGTDNAKEVRDMILTMTSDKNVLLEIVDEKNDFANHRPAMDELASDPEYSSDILGGQNPLPLYVAGIADLKLENLSQYDQGCNEEFQKAMKDYFDGVCDKDTALNNFKDAIKKKYPSIKVD